VQVWLSKWPCLLQETNRASLGVPENVGQFLRAGGHGATNEDWDALLDFADQYLMLRPGDRRFDVLPPESDLP